MSQLVFRHCVPGSAVFVSSVIEDGAAPICNAHHFGVNGLMVVDDEVQPDLATHLKRLASMPGSGVSEADSESNNMSADMEKAADDVQETALTAAQRLAMASKT